MLYYVPRPPVSEPVLMRDNSLSIGIVLLPKFSLFNLAALIEPMRYAAQMSPCCEPLCAWKVMSPDGASIESSIGFEIPSAELLGQPERFHYIAVVGGETFEGVGRENSKLLHYVKAASQRGVGVIGVGSGGSVLADAGLPANRVLCAHWLAHNDYTDRYTGYKVRSDQIYIVDGKHISCAGGMATSDLILHLLEKHCAKSQSRFAANVAMIEKPRRGTAAQSQMIYKIDISNDRVKRALNLMQTSMDCPLPVEDLADQVRLSKRQLERLFQKHLGLPVQAVSRRVRLRNGLFLLLTTKKTITEIAQDCGFSDSSHFTRKFIELFRVKPSQVREDKQLASNVVDRLDDVDLFGALELPAA